MIFLAVLLFVLSYVGIGLRVERNRYAIEHRKWRNSDSDELFLQKVKLETKLSSLSHKSYCRLNYSTLRSQGCDCGTQWHPLKGQLKNIERGILPEPKAQASNVMKWPVVFARLYIEQGGVKRTTVSGLDYDEIKRLEKADRELEEKLRELQ